MNHKIIKNETSYTTKTFLPLIIIMVIIIGLTFVHQRYYGFSFSNAMNDFMGYFFVIFALFKIINLSAFAEAYSMYDLVTQSFMPYGYVYPFIELFLGIAYILRFNLPIINWITLILMIIGIISVTKALANKKKITCACLGTVFKLPMTYVSLAENCIMALMSIMMIIINIYFH